MLATRPGKVPRAKAPHQRVLFSSLVTRNSQPKAIAKVGSERVSSGERGEAAPQRL